MRNQAKLMFRFSTLLAGTIIGMLLGYIADQTLTHYVLQHSEDMATVIITNSLSAFLVFPFITVVGAYIGYRLGKK